MVKGCWKNSGKGWWEWGGRWRRGEWEVEGRGIHTQSYMYVQCGVRGYGGEGAEECCHE